MSIFVTFRLSIFVTCALTMSFYTSASALGVQTDRQTYSHFFNYKRRLRRGPRAEREEVCQRMMAEEAFAKVFFIKTVHVLIISYI